MGIVVKDNKYLLIIQKVEPVERGKKRVWGKKIKLAD